MTEKALIRIMKAYEDKLLEFMDPEDYTEWSTKVAKDVFMLTVQEWPGELKEFTLEHLDEIFSETEWHKYEANN